MRREFGITEEDLLDRWDYWQTSALVEAAWEVLDALNPGETTAPGTGEALDLRSGKVGAEDLRARGFVVKGG